MVFVDDLAYYLFAIGFAGLFLAYIISKTYLSFRKGDVNLWKVLNDASIPMAFLGGYFLLSGFVSQMTWFLPGPYNMLFYDPMVSFGLILMAFSLAVRFKAKLQYVGFLSLMSGVMTIWYGISGYNLGLTRTPTELLGLFVLFGLAAIFAYPATLIADRFPKSKKAVPHSWSMILIIFWILLVFASLIAFVIGGFALPAHLATPP